MARTKRKNKDLAVEIGAIIQAHRKASNMTQETLSEMLELQPETISRMENGKMLPSVEKLVEIAEVFNLPVAAFFEHIDAGNRQPETALYAQRITAALEKLPLDSKQFVLKVAQDYAHYHVGKQKKRRAGS
jgi:transcriptional regulator with XRE-family HTH domain